MFAAMKKFALVMVLAAFPVQALAAIVVPLCHQDVTVASARDHGIQGGDQHDHDAPDQSQPQTVGDVGSDHCSAGSAFAIPVTLTKPAPAATAERGWFAAAHRSGFIPEQPQRPPLA